MGHFYDVIKEVRERPGMYMGSKSLTVLEAFLSGFSYALQKQGLDTEDIGLSQIPFHYFNDFVAAYYNYSESTSGWKNMILNKNNNDEEVSFDVFYKLFYKFYSIEIANIRKCALTFNHINYHYNNTKAPKHLLPPDYIPTEPCFINPKNLYLIELTENAGYLCMVELYNKNNLSLQLFKNKKSAIEYFGMSFGGSFIWKQTEQIPQAFEYCH